MDIEPRIERLLNQLEVATNQVEIEQIKAKLEVLQTLQS